MSKPSKKAAKKRRAKKAAGKRPAKKAPAKRPAKKPAVFKRSAPLIPLIGVQLDTTFVAVCITCDKRLGRPTTKKTEAEEQAENHAKLYRHKVDVISSDQ
jgi:hypothetical protein